MGFITLRLYIFPIFIPLSMTEAVADVVCHFKASGLLGLGLIVLKFHFYGN